MAEEDARYVIEERERRGALYLRHY